MATAARCAAAAPPQSLCGRSELTRRGAAPPSQVFPARARPFRSSASRASGTRLSATWRTIGGPDATARASVLCATASSSSSSSTIRSSSNSSSSSSSSSVISCSTSSTSSSTRAAAAQASMASESGSPKSSIRFEQPPRAVVVGGGPCGALAAMVLANHGFAVDVFERDGRKGEGTGHKGRNSEGKQRTADARKEEEEEEGDEERYTFPLALNSRAMKALEAVGAKLPNGASLMTGMVLHNEDKVTHTPRTTNVHYVERNWLASGLREQARQHPSGRVNVHCGWRLKSIDADCTIATFERTSSRVAGSGGGGPTAGSEFREVEFDLVVGADGAGSMARTEAASHDPTLEVVQRNGESLWEYKRLPKIPLTAFDHPSLSDLDREQCMRSSHTPLKKGAKTRLLVCPLVDAGYVTGLWFCLEAKKKMGDGENGGGKQSTLISKFQSVEEVTAVFREDHPKFFDAFVSVRPDLSEALLKQPVGSGAISTWCNRLHWKRMVLLGDAGHSMSSALGQGCNAALEDCVVLDKVLSDHFAAHEESPSDAVATLPSALQRFTAQRLEDAHAIVDLSFDPPSVVISTQPLTKARALLRMLAYMAASKVPGLKTEGKRRQNAMFSDLPFSEIKRIVKQDEAIAMALAGAVVAAAATAAGAAAL